MILIINYLLFTVYHYVRIVYMHEHLPFLILLRPLPDALDLHVQILDVLFLWSGVRWDQTCCEELEFLFTHSGFIVFLFIPVDSVVFLILYTLLRVINSFLYSYDIMCGHPYVVLQW